MPRRLIVTAVGGALILILATGLIVYSFSNARRSGCDSRNATADLFRDVIVIASTPDKGTKPKPLTPAQRDRLGRIFARIDRIRC